MIILLSRGVCLGRLWGHWCLRGGVGRCYGVWGSGEGWLEGRLLVGLVWIFILLEVCSSQREIESLHSGWYIVRAVLGLFNAYCMICFRDGVAKAFGRNAANWYAVFQASQFHMMYYASRTLPNFFAFGLGKYNVHLITKRKLLTTRSHISNKQSASSRWPPPHI